MTGPSAAAAMFPPLSTIEQRGRTLPLYMDRNGEYGEKRFLLLRTVGEKTLPANPWILSDTIKRAIGKIVTGRPLDSKTFLLETRSEKVFTELQKINSLMNGDKISITPHPTLNAVKFVFTCSSIGALKSEEIIEHMGAEGITDVYRFTKRVNGQIVQTNAYVVTMQAVAIPEYVYIGLEKIKTRVYYPRPMRCNRCLRFGHTTKNCANKEICANCGQDAHGHCTVSPTCVNCNEHHNTFDKKCPHYTKEAEIIKIKTDNNCSFREARLAYEQNTHKQMSNSFAQQRIAAAQAIDPKDKIIENLTQTVNLLKDQIAVLTKTIEKFTQTKQNKTECQNLISDSDTEDTAGNTIITNKNNKPSTFKHPLTSSSEELSAKKTRKGHRK